MHSRPRSSSSHVGVPRNPACRISLGSGPPSPIPESALAARYFREGAELDEGDEPQQKQALIAYRQALVLDPNLVPALVNLANMHYARDELAEAQTLYERALNLETECFEARFNLGNIHHDLGQYDEALTCYRDALDLNPTYADAHFYMAVTLEKLGPVQGRQAPLAHLPTAGPQRGVGRSRSGAERVTAPTGDWALGARGGEGMN